MRSEHLYASGCGWESLTTICGLLCLPCRWLQACHMLSHEKQRLDKHCSGSASCSKQVLGMLSNDSSIMLLLLVMLSACRWLQICHMLLGQLQQQVILSCHHHMAGTTVGSGVDATQDVHILQLLTTAATAAVRDVHIVQLLTTAATAAPLMCRWLQACQLMSEQLHHQGAPSRIADLVSVLIATMCSCCRWLQACHNLSEQLQQQGIPSRMTTWQAPLWHQTSFKPNFKEWKAARGKALDPLPAPQGAASCSKGFRVIAFHGKAF